MAKKKPKPAPKKIETPEEKRARQERAAEFFRSFPPHDFTVLAVPSGDDEE